MCDSTHSKRHCRVTSLSEDVIYKDVCTVGGFSCKFTALHWAMSQHERHVWETADEAKFFISFIHLWGRNVEWKKLRCLWKFPKTVKCEWEESAQGNCRFQVDGKQSQRPFGPGQDCSVCLRGGHRYARTHTRTNTQIVSVHSNSYWNASYFFVATNCFLWVCSHNDLHDVTNWVNVICLIWYYSAWISWSSTCYLSVNKTVRSGHKIHTGEMLRNRNKDYVRMSVLVS